MQYKIYYLILMSKNQIIKTSYHFFCFVFLLSIALLLKNINIIIKILLIFISIFHLYDTWWFLNNDGNAPI